MSKRKERTTYRHAHSQTQRGRTEH